MKQNQCNKCHYLFDAQIVSTNGGDNRNGLCCSFYMQPIDDVKECDKATADNTRFRKKTSMKEKKKNDKRKTIQKRL